jgi:predicted metalloprotease/WD40 repeat protein/tRNA A-37 threonylcarbamoyl transferase component Bud32
MADDHTTRPISEGDPPSGEPSSLKGLTMALGFEPVEPGHDHLLGCDIGGVTIARLIAEGGMGRVYEGKQEKPKRTVAVKVMRPGLTSPSILRRFEYEAEVLGRLQHPGIAHIYSVGVHQMGNATVPYFVMEYIADARTLTSYANDVKLPIRRRLELFRSVCDAVAHGHQKGVIHRDLKPSNILVDASGQPKVIDFGVARATDSDMALTTMQTDVGQLIGTLQYMSPEQFRADPNDIDVRSDVYALGVILYELLAGSMPYDLKKKALHEVARTVQEDDPTPLSSFNPALKGDMAVIASKCLEKERSRRYSSASEVGADIGRYLTGDPISASPPGFVDGLVRLARKHKAAAAAAAGVLVALVTATIGIGFFASRAEDARKEAETKASEAIRQAQRADSQALLAAAAAYKQSLLRLSAAVERKDFAGGRKLCPEVRSAWLAAQGGQAKSPLILRVLEQQLGTEPLATLVSPTAPISAITFGEQSNLLAAGHRDGSVTMWNLDTASLSRTMEYDKDDLARAPLLWLCFGEFAEKYQIAFKPGGQWLTTVSQFGYALTWDLANARIASINSITEDIPFLGGTLSADGSTYALTSPDGDTKVFDTESKQLRCVLPPENDLDDRDLLLGPDGKRIYVKDGFGDKEIRVLDTATGTPIATLKGCTSVNLAINNEGTRIAELSRFEPNLTVWDALSGEKLHSSPVDCPYPLPVGRIALSPDASRMAAADDASDRIVLIDVKSGQVVAHFAGEGTAATKLCFNVDGDRLASLHEDGSVCIWDGKHDDSLTTLHGLSKPLTSIEFSPSGTQIVTASLDGTVRIWDSDTYDPLTTLTCDQATECVHALFCNEGTRVAALFPDTIRVWEVVTGEPVPLAVIPPEEGYGGYGFFFDYGVALRWGISQDQVLRCRDIVTGEQLCALSGVTGKVESLAIDPGKTRFAVLSADGTLRLWDFISGSLLATINTRRVPGSPARIAFSPCGRVLTTMSTEGTKAWDAFTGTERAGISGKLGNQSLFSHDGGYLAAGTEDGTSNVLWAINQERLVPIRVTVVPVRERSIEDLFDDLPDAVEINDMPLANMRQAAERRVVANRLRGAGPLAFSADGGLVAFRDAAGTSFVHNTDGGELMVEFNSPGGVGLMSFAPDSSAVVVASASRPYARIYGRRPDEITRSRVRATEARARVTPIVDEWLHGDPAALRKKVSDSRSKMPAEEFHHASHLLLMRLPAKQLQSISPKLSSSRTLDTGREKGSQQYEEAYPEVVVACKENNDVWEQLYRKQFGRKYFPPTAVLFERRVQSACVTTNAAAVGTFYCPVDKKLFIDVSSHEDIKRRAGAAEGFASDYIIAHQFGHHIQNQLGISSKVQSMQTRLSKRYYNKLCVGLELQADFLAGVWAHHVGRYTSGLKENDIRVAMNAAAAIGADLQGQSRGDAVPDALGHGTTEQRVGWFLYGLTTGDPTLMDRAFERDQP